MSMRTLIIVGLLLLGSTATAQVDPGIRDTLRVVSVSAFANGRAVVPIRFYNDQQLSGLEATLTWDHPDVVVDSFSFSGSRVSYANLKGAIYDDSSITIYAYPFTGQPVVAVGNGLLGTLYLNYPSTIGDVLVQIDTTRLSIGLLEYASVFSSSLSVPISPYYVAGQVNILDTICCMGMRGNVDGDGADDVNVADITYLVSYLFQGGTPPPCMEEGNVDGGINESINVADITYLVTYLFQGGAFPPSCPSK